MSGNVKFKEDIITAIEDLKKTSEPANAPNVLVHLKKLINEDYADQSVSSTFDESNWKFEWSRRINAVVSKDVKKRNISKKHWNIIFGIDHNEATNDEQSSKSSSSTEESSKRSSTSSLSYQQTLSQNDYAKLQSIHNKLVHKWKLDSDTVVEDKMFEKFDKFSCEHPAHSYILNPNDSVWVNHFSDEDLINIKAAAINDFERDLPTTLKEAISKLNGKTTVEEIYEEISAIKCHKYKDPELFWLKESILQYIDLFETDKSAIKKTEQDLLDEVYGFIKQSRRISNTITETASSSIASSSSKNSGRCLGSVEAIARQASGDHADLVFKSDSLELGCVEIGLEDRGENATKELQEREFKTPRMMKAFFRRISEQLPGIERGKVKTIGFIISGFSITAVQMQYEKGSVCLLSFSKRYTMPESVAKVPAMLPPVLKLVYNCAKTIRSTVNHIEDVSSKVSDELEPTFIPPCFVPEANLKKRKTTP